MNRWIRVFALSIVVFGAATALARADITVSLSNVDVASGGVGTMDIYASSNSSDELNFFNLKLLITPTEMPSSTLTFNSSQPDFADNNSNYIFYGMSSLGAGFWGPPKDTLNGNDTSISGGDSDSADGGNGYVTLSSTPVLIAEVQFQSASGATPGDTFLVSLVCNPGLTTFQDANGDVFPYTVAKGGGMVTVVPAAVVVPEPSSSTTVAISSGLAGLLWYRRHRKASVKAN